MTGPPIENAARWGPEAALEKGEKNRNNVGSIHQPPGRTYPSPQTSEGRYRWCFTCGDHLQKDEPGPHCNQCIRWDRVIRGLQSAPPPRPIKPITLLRDHIEAMYPGGDPFLRDPWAKP